LSIFEEVLEINMSSRHIIDCKKVRAFEFERLGDPAAHLEMAPAPKEEPLVPKDLNDLEREAFEKGFSEGKKAGCDEASREIEAMFQRLRNSLTSLSDLRSKIITTAERDLVELAIEISKKLVHREVKIDEKIVVTLVRVALEKLSARTRAAVFVNPLDLEILKDAAAQLDSSEKELELKPDESLERGDCIVESDYGTVDARMSTQFKEIEAGLLGGF
jgi:flagellar assembly protein FliH